MCVDQVWLWLYIFDCVFENEVRVRKPCYGIKIFFGDSIYITWIMKVIFFGMLNPRQFIKVMIWKYGKRKDEGFWRDNSNIYALVCN